LSNLSGEPGATDPAGPHVGPGDSRDQLLRLLDVAQEALFERIGDDDALFVTDRLWTLLGYEPGDVPALRSALASLLHPDDRPQSDELIAQAVNADVLIGRLRCSDGSYRWFRQRTQVAQLADGRACVRGSLADVDDVERARAAAAAKRVGLVAEADRDSAAKLRLVAHASHEIRTPLNGVLGLVDLAQRIASSEAQRRYLELAAQSGRALLRVLNDVLDFARLDAAPAIQPLDWFDPDQLLAEAARSITPQIGWRDFSVVYDFDGDALQVQADGGRLRQIVVNLLGNAARHTVRGHIGLTARAVWIGDGRCELYMRVEDTGPGIPADRLPRLFDPFALADDAKLHGGTGLGLSIVHALVATMGGRIQVQSTVGEGTAFELRFEFRAVCEELPLPTRAPGHAWLIYEPPFVDGGVWLARRLARFGWTSELLPSLDAAVARTDSSPPNLVIVAAHSVHTGDDLPRLAAVVPHLRPVLVSRPDWQHPEFEQQAFDLGGAVLHVPVARRDLLTMTGMTPAQPLPSKLPANSSAPLRGHVLLVDDDEVNRLVGESVLCALNLSVICVDSGEAAIAACATKAPDLVLMDVRLPGIDGAEATRQLRDAQARGELKRFPIIGFTADPAPAVSDACLDAGMDAILAKPCALETMRLTLSPWLSSTLRPPD